MARVIWAALLLAGGAGQLSAAWSGPTATIALVGAAVVPLLLVALAARLRVPPPVSAVLLVAATLAGAYLWAVPDGVAPLTGLRDAVARLLTAERPAPITPQLLAPGIVLCVVVAVWAGLRSGALAGPVGAFVLYVSAALLTAGTADPYGLVAAGLVIVCAFGWFVLDRPRPPWTAGVIRLAPAVTIAAAACLGVALVWSGPGFEPRHLVEPPRSTLQETSPLPRIASWQQHGDTELLRVTAEGQPRLRLVVLTEFTGATWSATATYRRIGTAPSNPSLVEHQATVSAQVSIAGLDGPWLPTPGRAVSVSLSDVDVEPDTGALALRDGVARPGVSYTVRAVVDTPTANDVAAARVPLGEPVRGLLDVPSLPWAFSEYARQITFGASTPFEQAVAIEYATREGRRLDASAPVGSSYARLQTFLFADSGSEPGARTGTSEQFATAFAVLARSVGLPTRVVVGFGPGTPGPDGTRVVRGRDVIAWPEVYFEGRGWYAFDPTPGPDVRSTSDEQLKLKALDRMGEQVARVVAVPTPSAAVPRPTPTHSASAAPVSSTQTPMWTLSLLALPIAFLIVVIVGRALRRSRHRRAGDRGAWAEVLDLLVLMGRPAPRWLPAPEIAAELALVAPSTVAGPHPAARIAAAADTAAFSPTPRADQGSWRAVAELRRTVRKAVPLRRRLSWPLDPRPLLRRRPHARSRR